MEDPYDEDPWEDYDPWEDEQEDFYCECPHHRKGCGAKVDFEGDRCPMCEEACGP